MRVEIVSSHDGLITVRPLDKVNAKDFEEYNGRFFGYLDPWKKGSGTDEQRKHYWALIKDISQGLADSVGEARLQTFAKWMFENGKDDFISVSRNKQSKEEMTSLIQACISFALERGIPLGQSYVDYYTNQMFYRLLMDRRCWICGRQGDIAHVQAVGVGRNRKHIDHAKHELMCLCREHHTEQHRIGIDTFMTKYKIEQGIKLSDDDIKKLGI